MFLFAVLLTINTHAEDMSIYDAEVSVDATDINAASAREKAMTEANRKALYAVTNRISAASSTDILDSLNDNQILNFIHQVSVITEKVSEQRYIASLKITINAPILKAYLAEKNAPVTIMPKSNINIIPIYYATPASSPQLWEDTNIWYTAWQNNPSTSGQITILPISKDSNNQTLLTAEDAISLNHAQLSILSSNNNSELYIAIASQQDSKLQIELKSPNQGLVKTFSYPNADSENMEQAIQTIKSIILQQIQQQTLAKENSRNKMIIVYNYNNLKNWLKLQNILKNIDQIKTINIDAMSNHKAQVSIEFSGSEDNIQNRLSQYNYTLIDNGNFYSIEGI